MNKYVQLTAIMNDHAGRESACGWEMGNHEFTWSGLKGWLNADALTGADPDFFKRGVPLWNRLAVSRRQTKKKRKVITC